MTVIGIVLLSAFLSVIAIGAPLAIAMCSSCLVVLVVQGLPLSLLAHQMMAATTSYAIIAIPGFLLLGGLMTKSGFVERLISFSMALVGWIQGGLSLVTIVAAMIFAGITGSGTADAAAVGSISIPALKKAGYEPGHAAALTAAGGIIGPIIPPSIPMIVYGVMTNTSVPALFVGGYIPGILLGLGFMVYLYFIARKRGYGQLQTFSFFNLAKAFRRSFWALMAPVIIIGGMVSGIVTATEAAVIGIAYVLFFGLVIYREMKVADLFPILIQVATLTGVIMFLLTMSTLFGWIMARENIPELVVKGMLSISSNKYVVLLAINVLILILGCLMDTIAIMIICVPILFPVALTLGIDPIHFGVVFTVNVAIGLITPPVGYALYVTSSIAQINVEDVIQKIIPLIVIAIVVLFLITYIPSTTMFLPHLFFKKGL